MTDPSTGTVPRRRRGRAPLEAAERRETTISARLNPAELAIIDKRRGNIPRGEYLRSIALNKLPPTIPAINREAWAELARLAANLNQIARRLNAGGNMATEISATRDLLNKLRSALIGVTDDEG